MFTKCLILSSIILLLGGAPVPRRDAKVALAWENIKSMAGEWDGAATDGRKIRHRVQLIAANSVVMEESWFEGHRGELMVTMYHMDGDRLTLTHYCVAKNQPRMEATEISDDGKRVLFTFKDGANIPTRDKGHMDKAMFKFPEKDKMSSQWTWFASGKEQWMEEFQFGRVKGSAPETGTTGEGCCPK